MTTRVIHVASGREWRGGQRQVWMLARELARLGDAEQVVVTGAGSELARRIQGDGIRVRAVRWTIGLDPRVLPALLDELRVPAALVHAHDGHAARLAGLAARVARRPLVLTRRVEFPLRRPGYWTRADRVIAVSAAVARRLEAAGVPASRVSVIHSAIVPEETARTPPLGIRARLGLAEDTLVAASVGNLEPGKDHATLLRAADRLAGRLPALHWVVAGEGPERPSLERLIAELGLRGRVHLIGHLDDPARLIADADLFVMSSREEGLGTSVLEAMALGTPVASTAAGGLPEMLDEGAGLLAPPGDPEALAEAMARLVEDPWVARSVTEQAAARLTRFTAARMAEAVRSVYRSCATFT